MQEIIMLLKKQLSTLIELRDKHILTCSVSSQDCVDLAKLDSSSTHLVA